MKYEFLNKRQRKKLHIEIPSRGMNLKSDPSQISDSELGLCENVIYSDGLIKTRAGLFANEDKFLDISECENAWYSTYKLTGIKVNYQGKQMELAFAMVDYDYSTCYILTYLIDSEANAHSIGFMQFFRTNESLFNRPESVLFYTGEEDNESRVFAFVKLSNANAENEKSYVCYKTNSQFTDWERHTDFYIPTIYINGRGNAYSQALSLDLISSFTPKVLESRNMLNNAFYAYFTSDGCSSVFKLPLNELDNLAVKCTIYTAPNIYTSWEILPDQTSQEKDFCGANITMSVDRITGTVFFTVSDKNYPIPVFDKYRDNNIKIMACKKIEGGFDAVASCDSVCRFGTGYIFSGGTEKNKVYYIDCENPTYFPFISDNAIGNSGQKVIALCNADGQIYAFKEDEIYSLNISGGEAFNTTTLVSDNGKFFSSPFKFRADCIANGMGLTLPQTLCVMHSDPIWLSKNGEILKLVNGRIISCSNKISPKLKEYLQEETNASFSAVWSNYYILFIRDKAVVLKFGAEEMKYKSAEIAGYLWRFPECVSVAGGLGSADGPLLMLCQYKNNERCYIATLEGDVDISFKDGIKTTEKIGSLITLKSYLLSSVAKRNRINSAVILFSAKGKVKITVLSKYASREFKFSALTSGFDAAELLCDIANTDTVGLQISAQDTFSFAGADIYYTEAV